MIPLSVIESAKACISEMRRIDAERGPVDLSVHPYARAHVSMTAEIEAMLAARDGWRLNGS